MKHLDTKKRLDEQMERALADADKYSVQLHETVNELLKLKGIKHL